MLRQAAKNGDTALTKKLIEANADIDQADNEGRNPLYVAAQEGHDKVVELLLTAGADKDKAMTRNGCTPLFVAAWKGHDACLRWLLHAPDGPRLLSQLELLDHDGRTVATLARMNGQGQTADWLQRLIDERAAARAAAVEVE